MRNKLEEWGPASFRYFRRAWIDGDADAGCSFAHSSSCLPFANVGRVTTVRPYETRVCRLRTVLMTPNRRCTPHRLHMTQLPQDAHLLDTTKDAHVIGVPEELILYV